MSSSFTVKLFVAIGIIGFLFCAGGYCEYDKWSNEGDRDSGRAKEKARYALELEEYERGRRPDKPIAPAKYYTDREIRNMRNSLLAIYFGSSLLSISILFFVIVGAIRVGMSKADPEPKPEPESATNRAIGSFTAEE